LSFKIVWGRFKIIFGGRTRTWRGLPARASGTRPERVPRDHVGRVRHRPQLGVGERHQERAEQVMRPVVGDPLPAAGVVLNQISSW
jgi:hypothetical protein